MGTKFGFLFAIFAVLLHKTKGYGCPNYEEYTDCVITCNDCVTKGDCDQFTCNPGCDCIQGYYRNKHGSCVPEYQCETSLPVKSCPPNEQYTTCAVPCNDCINRGNCHFLGCSPGCDCIKGYYRNEYNICVREKMCPGPEQCKPNEEYYECMPTCRDTCLNFMSTGQCPNYCKSGCHCREGLLRNNKGECVRPNECPNKFCGLNEEYSDCVVPCNTCRLRGNCEYYECEYGCDCRKGYYRNEMGVCVHEKHCPYTGTCAPDEKYYQCVPNCKNTCENYFRKSVSCPKICQPGCFCQEGLLKRSDGYCVKPEDCDPVTCDPDEQYYPCIPFCTNVCETLNRTDYSCAAVCIPGCFCKEGLVKRTDGKCVLPQQCRVDCGPNKEYYSCMPDCKHTCENFTNPNAICPYNSYTCKAGCFCREGFVKRRDGKCVKPTECVQTPCPSACLPDQKFYTCMPDCFNTCENFGNPNRVCTFTCKSGCFCKEGLVKRKDGKCVRPAECPKVSGCLPDEKFYNCMPDCFNTCENFGNPNRVCTLACKSGCFCKEGLVKRKDGKCVRPSECPRVSVCGPDEQFFECVPECKNTCEHYNNQSLYCSLMCKSGCFCRVGLVKRKDGKCVPPSQCPKDTCKRLEQQYNCIPYCRNTCENFNNSAISCHETCMPGCFCRKGLLKRKDGKCVKPVNCNKAYSSIFLRSSGDDDYDFETDDHEQPTNVSSSSADSGHKPVTTGSPNIIARSQNGNKTSSTGDSSPTKHTVDSPPTKEPPKKTVTTKEVTNKTEAPDIFQRSLGKDSSPTPSKSTADNIKTTVPKIKSETPTVAQIKPTPPNVVGRSQEKSTSASSPDVTIKILTTVAATEVPKTSAATVVGRSLDKDQHQSTSDESALKTEAAESAVKTTTQISKEDIADSHLTESDPNIARDPTKTSSSVTDPKNPSIVPTTERPVTTIKSQQSPENVPPREETTTTVRASTKANFKKGTTNTIIHDTTNVTPARNKPKDDTESTTLVQQSSKEITEADEADVSTKSVKGNTESITETTPFTSNDETEVNNTERGPLTETDTSEQPTKQESNTITIEKTDFEETNPTTVNELSKETDEQVTTDAQPEPSSTLEVANTDPTD